MIKVYLSQGYFASVDDAHFDLVSKYRWRVHKTKRIVYARAWTPMINKKRSLISMHRLIAESLFGGIGEGLVDHVDGDGLNNVSKNIRLATRSENAMNRAAPRLATKTSRFKGVGFKAKKQRWTATIIFKSKTLYIGSFGSEIEAANAYDAMARIHHGEFAKVNFQS